MKILYLHGYQGKPSESRIKYLENMGFEVEAPYIDYDNRPNIIEELKVIDFDYVIGNSLGGYVGFYLSELKGKQAILINPPLYMNLPKILNLDIVLPTIDKNCLQKLDVILGDHDEIVDTMNVVEWLTEHKPCVSVNILEGVGHHHTKKQFIEFTEGIIKEW